MRSFLVPALLFLAGAAPIRAQTLAPEVDPARLFRDVAGSPVLGGAIRSSEIPARVRLTINGEDAGESGTLRLIAPGEKLRLQAELLFDELQLAPPPTKDSILRQTALTDYFWETGEGDWLEPAGGLADGTATWITGASDGRPQWISVHATRLQVQRTARDIANPDFRVTAPLASASTKVWILGAVPFDRNGDGLLQGVNIGVYPNETSDRAPGSVRDRADAYAPPAALYRLDQQTAPARLTKAFTLGSLNPPIFAEEAAPDAVRFVAVGPRLVRFLRAFEAKLEQKKLHAPQLIALRGFVSPVQRARLERAGESIAEFSRFQYGDAIALVYDARTVAEREAPGAPPAKLADLTGDGKVTIEDADALGDVAKQTMDELQMYGGLGIGARFNAANPTPYVHIDLRGVYTPFREE